MTKHLSEGGRPPAQVVLSHTFNPTLHEYKKYEDGELITCMHDTEYDIMLLLVQKHNLINFISAAIYVYMSYTLVLKCAQLMNVTNSVRL